MRAVSISMCLFNWLNYADSQFELLAHATAFQGHK